ncbi:MAG: hypothetical protein ABR905_19765 [Terracidiphilus sp.]|jgi:hypothetical protein
MPVKLDNVRILVALLLSLTLAVAAHGQAALAPAQAQALVGRALATEFRSAQDLNHPMRYRLHRSSPRLTSTKEIVETRDGFVARLVAINDQPLSASDEQKEQARLDALLSDPSQQRHRKQGEDQDTGIVLKLLRMLPEAFLYDYAGRGQAPTGSVERFRFHPNPHFIPPDLETQALTAMTGEIWIDPTGERVARLEGHLAQDTDYGWGILGKLDKGGWVVLEQASVGGGQWRIAHFQMKMTLRILFKNKSFDTTQEMTGYAPVPANLDYRQAIQMLRAMPATTAHAGH